MHVAARGIEPLLVSRKLFEVHVCAGTCPQDVCQRMLRQAEEGICSSVKRKGSRKPSLHFDDQRSAP